MRQDIRRGRVRFREALEVFTVCKIYAWVLRESRLAATQMAQGVVPRRVPAPLSTRGHWAISGGIDAGLRKANRVREIGEEAQTSAPKSRNRAQTVYAKMYGMCVAYTGQGLGGGSKKQIAIPYILYQFIPTYILRRLSKEGDRDPIGRTTIRRCERREHYMNYTLL